MTGFEPLGRHTGDAIVAIGKDGVRTASDLASDVAALSRELAGRTGPVLLYCADRYHLALSAIAAWQVGLTIALPPNGRAPTLAQIAAYTGFSMGDAEGFDIDVRECLSGQRIALGRLRPISPERPLATLFTSGSTGAYRACNKVAGQLLGEASSLVETFGFGPETCVLATVPAHHIYGLLLGVLVPLLSGGRFVRETPLHVEAIEDLAQRTHASTLVSAPPHLYTLAHAPSLRLPSVQAIFSSGAPLQATDAEALHARTGVPIHELLGSTETGGYAHRRAERRSERWRPLPHVTVGADEEGALLLTSAFLDPEQAQPMPCPDRIELEPDGSFEHLGRVDGVVKIGGTRVSIPQLVAYVLALPGVTDAAALAVDVGHARGQEVWLAVVGGPDVSAQAVKAQLARSYEAIATPRRVRVVSHLPREATGKLPREALLALFSSTRPDAAGLEYLERSSLSLGAEGSLERIRLRVPQDWVYFDGHFPGDPLLPGAAQLDSLVLPEVELRWPELAAPSRVSRIKFKQPIRRGDELCLELHRSTTRSRVDFVIRREGSVCSQGTLEYARSRQS